jgi:hypothetical protein
MSYQFSFMVVRHEGHKTDYQPAANFH